MKHTVPFLALLFFGSLQAQCWADFDNGGFYTLALHSNGTLWSWGVNYQGQLGIGNNINQYSMTQVGTDNDWRAVEAGAEDSFAIKTNGTLWAWGRNEYGQLGIGTTQTVTVPVQVGTDTDWKLVSNHGEHTFALKNDNTLWGWGDETAYFGFVNSTTPVQIGTATWKTVYAGLHHVFAIQSDGTLWAWGYNPYGELGDGTITNRPNPVQIGTDNQWALVSGFANHTLAIKNDGTLWGWGNNTYGTLGDGTVQNHYSPTQVGTATDWKFVSAEYPVTHAIKTDGSLWAWGSNSGGQYGNGNTLSSVVPVHIGTASNWKYLKPNFTYSQMGIRDDGTLWGWADNSYGQMTGNGTNDESIVPVQVICPNLAVNENQIRPIVAYPNPVKDLLYFSSDVTIDQVLVYDLTGRTLLSATTVGTAVDLSGLPTGNYWVKVATAQGSKCFTIAKM